MNLRGLKVFVKRYTIAHAIAAGGYTYAGIRYGLAGWEEATLIFVIATFVVGLMTPPTSHEE
jgi:hypothetical protein